MLVGPPGSFKSFLAIDWAMSLAAGIPWSGRATKPSKVLYTLGEGKASLLKRIMAWVHHKKLTQEQEQRLKANFRVTFDVPQLAAQKEMLKWITDFDNDAFDPTFLIIDTLARSYVGKNENDAMDVGIWIDNVDKLRKRGMTVLVLHHTKKNTEGGLKYRGNTAWLGAMDTSFVLERNPDGIKGISKLSCDKQKDHQEPQDIWMRSMQIRPDPNSEGSIVLTEVEAPDGEAQERRVQDAVALDEMIHSLLEDATFDSDRARARALAERANILEATAQTKIFRARKTWEYNAKR
jgi:RecA-family ATPase